MIRSDHDIAWLKTERTDLIKISKLIKTSKKNKKHSRKLLTAVACRLVEKTQRTLYFGKLKEKLGYTPLRFLPRSEKNIEHLFLKKIYILMFFKMF